MADSLNLGVIAEGVEKRSQLDSCEEGSAHEADYQASKINPAAMPPQHKSKR
jgi:hypothetical protein